MTAEKKFSVLPPITGYPARLSAKPGEKLAFHVSSAGGMRFSAAVVRIHCADPNPVGPGCKMEKVDFGLSDSYRGVEQAAHKGSCALGSLPNLDGAQELLIELTIKPMLRSGAMQTLIALQSSESSAGLALALREGRLTIRRLGHAQEPQAIDTGVEIRADTWTRLRITLGRSGKTTIEAVEVDLRESGRDASSVTEVLPYGLIDGLDMVCLGAVWKGHPEAVFEGCLEAPGIFVLDPAGAGAGHWYPIAMWDFSQSIPEQVVPNSADGPGGLTLINLPRRAVRSSTWSGRHMVLPSALSHRDEVT